MEIKPDRVRVCRRCVMDETDPDISFDADGYCNRCTAALAMLSREPFSLSAEEKRGRIETIASDAKRRTRSNRYDCVIGLSGGVDSTYTALLVRELGLRPLAVHLDNGWDSELAVVNIENICRRLDIDLHTHVIDWEQFRDLQLSFLKASTPDSEIPSDHAIIAVLSQLAAANGVKYIFGGTNHATESIGAQAWSYGHMDWKYIRSVHKEFGTKKLSTYPHLTIANYFRYRIVLGVKWISLLDYFAYDKAEAKRRIIERLSWRDYGGKHYESIYTKFFQAHILPEKFGFDKRKAHLSSLICSGQITRDQALKELELPLYSSKELRDDTEYVAGKLGMDPADFQRIMTLQPRKFADYPSYERSWYYKAALAAFNSFKRAKGVHNA